MDKILDNFGNLFKFCSNAAELYEFYQSSELVKISVSISNLFHKYAQSSDEYEKKHNRLAINDLILQYKNSLQEIGVNIADFTW